MPSTANPVLLLHLIKERSGDLALSFIFCSCGPVCFCYATNIIGLISLGILPWADRYYIDKPTARMSSSLPASMSNQPLQ